MCDHALQDYQSMELIQMVPHSAKVPMRLTTHAYMQPDSRPHMPTPFGFSRASLARYRATERWRCSLLPSHHATGLSREPLRDQNRMPERVLMALPIIRPVMVLFFRFFALSFPLSPAAVVQSPLDAKASCTWSLPMSATVKASVPPSAAGGDGRAGFSWRDSVATQVHNK
mmetsp:Transcript_43999/g.141065  ORF Transcript_43999/g.141065 Transcript_43999/m.141065 type:complete len:171 (+) Transcript_43999:57-569(+)